MALRVAIASGNWSNPAIWNDGVLPNPGDIVASNGFTVTIDQNITVDLLTNAATAPGILTAQMTSNTTPSGIVTASSFFVFGTSYDPFRAFDRGSNDWITSTGNLTGWIAYEFPSVKTVKKYIMTPATTGSPTSVPRDWTFEGWTGSVWVVLDTVTGNSGTATVARNISNTTPYIKYRINITANNGSTNYTGITELFLLEANDYGSTSTAGGGFICSSSVTINLTGISVANGCLIGSTVLRWTGGSGVTTNLNVTSIREYNNTLSVEGTGTLNFTGTINNTIPNTSTRVINVTGVCTFNIVGTLNPQSGSNQPENTELIYVASAATVNITGSFISTSSAGCCVRVGGINAVINITGDLSNTSNIGYNGNLIIVLAVCTINITGNCTGRVLNSSSAGYLKIIGSITASNFNGQISVISTNASGINLFSGPFISSTYGIFPYQVIRMHLIPTTNSYIEFRDETTNGALSPGAIAPATRLVSPATLVDNLAPSDVRFGTSYALGTLTGTLRMPVANQVTFGVQVDNTFGNAVLTADGIWNYLVSNLNTPDSIGMRLKNVSTPQTTGEQLEAFLRLD
jgi:hypothetical protein